MESLTLMNVATGLLVFLIIVLVIRIAWRIFRKPSAKPQPNPYLRKARVPNPEPEVLHQTEPTSVEHVTPSTWSDRRLFSNEFAYRSTEDDLPHVDPEDVPNSDSSDYIFGSWTPLLAQMLPESDDRRKEARKDLRQAGFYQPHAMQNFTAMRYVLVMAPLLFFGVLLILVPRQIEMIVIMCMVIVPGLAWAIPRLYISNRAATRKTEIELAMPDMLDMLNMCVSQGLTIHESLRRIAPDLKPVYPELARELTIVDEQAVLGSMEQALINLNERVNIPEVHSFTSLIIQTERMGTSISDALAEYSDTMREGLRQRADQKANQASFKLLFPTVLCLMPAVYIFLLSPAIIEVTRFLKEGGREALDQGQQAIQTLRSDDQ